MEKTITEINNKTLKQVLVVDDMGHITRAGLPVKTFEQKWAFSYLFKVYKWYKQKYLYSSTCNSSF